MLSIGGQPLAGTARPKTATLLARIPELRAVGRCLRGGKGTMLQAARNLVSSLASGREAPCTACDPEVLARCEAAKPGSVKQYNRHVLIRLPVPADADRRAPPGAWWPRTVER